jgi:CDP-diacylglycerol--serine O-phosphatidyltransferase
VRPPDLRRRARLHELHPANLLTYTSLAGVVLTLLAGGRRNLIALGLATAVVADTFDGRFARCFRRTPHQARIGAELDSLVDALAFGLTPVAALAAVARPEAMLDQLMWGVAAMAYLVAAVTRLAFFNAVADDSAFMGLPSPAAALLCLASLLVPVPESLAWWPLLVGAAAMVAPFRVPRPGIRGLLAFASCAVAVGLWLVTTT